MNTIQITEDDQAQIIANTGIALTRFSHHAVERCEERKINFSEIIDILKTGEVRGWQQMRNSKLAIRIWKGCTKVVFGKDGTVVSVIKYNKKEKKKYYAEVKRRYWE